MEERCLPLSECFEFEEYEGDSVDWYVDLKKGLRNLVDLLYEICSAREAMMKLTAQWLLSSHEKLK